MAEKYPLKQINLNFTCDPNTLRRFWTYCRVADTEISALAEADILVNVTQFDVHVTDKLHMVKQKGSIGGTRLDMGAIADVLTDCITSGRNPEKLRVWIHKHPGSVYFSNTDENTIKELSQVGINPLIAGVFNNAGDMHWGIFQSGETVVEFDTVIKLPEPSEAEVNNARPMIDRLVQKLPLFGRQRCGGTYGGWLFGGGK